MARLSLRTRYKRARKELEKMGVQFAHDSWGDEANGGFAISGECGVQGTEEQPLIVDYWHEDYTETNATFGVDHKINAVLKKYGLFHEWVNAGVLGVWDARW